MSSVCISVVANHQVFDSEEKNIFVLARFDGHPQPEVVKSSTTSFFLVGEALFKATPAACEGSQAGGGESELKPLACTTATATPDPSHICDLHYS